MDFENALIYTGFAAAATGLAYRALTNQKPLDPGYNFKMQSIEIDSKERIRVCSTVKDGKLMEYRYHDVRTIHDVLRKGLKRSNDGPCLGKRDGPGKGPYRWISFSGVIKQVENAGSGLVNKGIVPGSSNNIGIYSSNRPEWIVAEHACYAYSFVVVSLYDSYGRDSIKYVINHADLKAIFVDNFYRLMNILENIDEFLELKVIVYFDEMNELRSKRIKSVLETKQRRSMIELISFDELLKSGRTNPQSLRPPKPTDLATICYTSGTTGEPKGAMISHANFICNEACVFTRLYRPHLKFELSPSDIHFCYLPLAHLFGRMALVMGLNEGVQCGFLSGDVSHILDDMQELKPTYSPMVPRLLNKLFDQVQKKVLPSLLKRFVLSRGIKTKLRYIENGVYQTNTFYDRKIFNEVKANFGGKLTKSLTSSAPISKEVMRFSRAALSCPIAEAYGQTESTCAITCTHPCDPEIDHVGPPVACWMVKLIDVPEMNYFAKDNKGEICGKGPCVFLGYLKDPTKTAEVIDQDGWLHTGDIGEWLPNGTLRIIDRKKNLFKLSIGEYISPEKLENIYIKSPFVSQIFVDGDSLKEYCVAIVVPDVEYLEEFFRINLNMTAPVAELAKNKMVRQKVLNDIIRVGKNAGLVKYELIKIMHLHLEPFTIENGFLTPTLKLKRQVLSNHFKATIKALYKDAELDAQTFSKNTFSKL